MAGTPTAERPPEGLNAHWLGVWRHALKTLKEQDTWAWEQKPLLDEYVFALRGASEARKGFKWLEQLPEIVGEHGEEVNWTVLGTIASGLPTQWDRHVKRAAALADLLALTPRARKAIGIGQDDDEDIADPFAQLDGGQPQDEVAQRRKRKATRT